MCAGIRVTARSVKLSDFYAAGSDSYPCQSVLDEVPVSVIDRDADVSIRPSDRSLNVQRIYARDQQIATLVGELQKEPKCPMTLG